MPAPRRLGLESLEPRDFLHAGVSPNFPNLAVNSQAEAARSGAEIVSVPSANAAAARAAAVSDDVYENNDTFGSATNLGTLTSAKTIDKLVMNDAADWYKFTMNSVGTSSDYVKISFTHTQGDLDLQLYSTSNRLLLRSQGITNSEQLSLKSLAAGTYYIRIYGYRGAHNPNYSLKIDPATIVLPSAAPPAVASASTSFAAPPPATPPLSLGAFNIELNFQGLTSSERAVFNRAAERWEQIIVGDLPSAIYNGRFVDDLLINASAVAIDGVGGTLGQAGPDRFRSGTLFPYHGSMQFDTADLAAMERNGTLLSVIEHEIGHILGIGTLWNDRGLLSGAGTSDPRFTGSRATAEYNAIFGVHENGVPVESGGGAGTRDAHWRESVLVTELMTGWAGPGSSLPLSRISIASLSDLGYQVDMSQADNYFRPGSTTSNALSTSTSGIASLMAYEESTRRSREALDQVMTCWE